MMSELQDNREPTIFNSLLTDFFVAILLFIALLYRQGDLTLLTLLILLVVAGARAWSSLSLSGINCAGRVDKQRAFRGETLALETTVENAKFLPVWIRILWPFDDALRPAGGDEKILRREAGFLWHQRVQFSWHLTALRRGVHRVGPPRILAGDLLGFFQKEKRSADSIEIIVYPQLICLKSVLLPKRDLFGVPGAKSPVKDPIYILGTRDYQPSRPSRYIHWKATARHLRLQEKIFEHALEVIASLAVQLESRGYAVGLAADGNLTGGGLSVVPTARGPGQLAAILETLARMQMVPDGALGQVIRQSLGSQPGVSCAYFSYDYGQAAVETENYCRQRNLPLSFWICHPQPKPLSIRPKHAAGIHILDGIRIPESKPL
jgi:uncharacterized protein (DUF58 family)